MVQSQLRTEPTAVLSLLFLIRVLPRDLSFLSSSPPLSFPSPLPSPAPSSIRPYLGLFGKTMKLGPQQPVAPGSLKRRWRNRLGVESALWRRFCKVIKGAKNAQYLCSVIFPFLFRLQAMKKSRLRDKGIGFILFKVA